jgi:hypothetical protein
MAEGLPTRRATSRNRLKDAEADLDAKAYARYPKLTESEIKTVVVDDKWLAALDAAIRQCLSNQQPDFNQKFFSTVQFVFAGNDSEGLQYGTVGTPEKYFLGWKEDEQDDSRFKLDKYLLKSRLTMPTSSPSWIDSYRTGACAGTN